MRGYTLKNRNKQTWVCKAQIYKVYLLNHAKQLFTFFSKREDACENRKVLTGTMRKTPLHNC